MNTFVEKKIFEQSKYPLEGLLYEQLDILLQIDHYNRTGNLIIHTQNILFI